MIEKKKSLVKKILFMLMIIIAVILINSTDSQAFIMGSLDIDGGQGITAAPEPYLFGDYFCTNHSLPLVRTEDGTKNSEKVVYINRLNGTYYNEEIYYSSSGQFNIEQSIAAGRIAYQCGAGGASEFQNVVWASGQWSGKSGYVNNLSKYTGTTVSDTTALYERAEGWANFYYNLLQPSGMTLNIDVQPTSEEDMRVYVDQNARTYTQGPYMISILNSSGADISNTPTEYHSAGTIGNLLYQELSGLNAGCRYFQFAKLNSATATVSYTDGSTEEFSNITILDANGNALAFPKPGEIFYIRIEIPSGESRTVSKIEPHFTVQYLTQIPGTVNEYKASQINYELTVDKASEFTDSVFFSESGRTTTFLTNKSVTELADLNVKTDTQLENHLVAEILDSYVGPSKINMMRRLPGFTALFMDHDLLGEERIFNNVDDYIQACIDAYQADERGKITSTTVTETTYEYKDYENGGSYVTDSYQGEEGLLGTNTTSTTTWYYGPNSYSSLEGAEAEANLQGEKLGNEHAKANMDKEMWIYSWVDHLPVVAETTDSLVSGFVQSVIEVHLRISGGVSVGDVWTWAESSTTTFDLIGTDCTVEIGGKVWFDGRATKEDKLNGRLNSGNADTYDYRYAGMQVELHLGDRNGTIIYTTTTDGNGEYHFDKLNALEKYTVVFTYNGQLYQQTYYKDDLSGGFSNAHEVDRTGLNDRFDNIDSYPANYNRDGSWRIAYGPDVKLRDNNGNYISNGTDSDGNNVALTYQDAWNQFVNFARDNKSYAGAYNSLRNWLNNRGVGSTDVNGVIQFIQDCMIIADTRTYPVYEQFVIENIDDPGSQPATETAVGQTWNSLYITSSDQSRNVDFGIGEREIVDIGLTKDVFKVTARVNGKTQTYRYDRKDSEGEETGVSLDEDGNWSVEVRQSDALYNGNYVYNREIRRSEYLYDGTVYSAEAGGTSAKDLRIFVTYKITVRNLSEELDVALNEVIDYFDASEYVFDGELNGTVYTPNEYSDFEDSTITSYIGTRDGEYLAPLVVSTESVCGNGRADRNIGHGFDTDNTNGDSKSPLYLSGEATSDGLTPIKMPTTDSNGNTVTSDLLTHGGGMTYIYLTFEVKKATDENGMANRIKMDVDVSNQTVTYKGPGKQNIAEVNSYSTYYQAGATVPDTLDANNNTQDRDVGGQKAGIIDTNSTPGNLTSQDLSSTTENETDGRLIITDDELTNRAENDEDQAPNIRLVFPTDNGEGGSKERTAIGYVFEDERNVASNLASVGNGRYATEDGDVKVNGVTVQLVELVQNVDEDGIPIRDDNGNYEYLGEYIWSARQWTGGQWINVNSSADSDSLRYYSGQGGTVSPIISGPTGTATEISGYTFDSEDSEGQYAFKGMPAGDLIIRFIYGDTTQTVLTTTDGEGSDVANFLTNAGLSIDKDSHDGFISTSGLNAKSYNGQDYKSTVYQTDIDQGAVGSYNNIYGFGYDANGLNESLYDTQNYNYTEDAQVERGEAGQPISNYVNTTDGKDKAINYYYNIGESQVQSGVSDAKDVLNTRLAANDYSRGIANIDGETEQTIVNGRAEVLVSGLKLGSTETLETGAAQSVEKQVQMLKELMDNTYIVAQSGVINTEIEHNKEITENQGDDNNDTIGYILDDIDLGLTERPVAQLKMNKEVSNVRITLQDGTILFDTDRPVTNMSYAEHPGHEIVYDVVGGSAYRLKEVLIAQEQTDMPELITTYMDEELMYGARVEVDYEFTVTNVGEVDYKDNKFYYTGVSSDPDNVDNISTTAANTVVDYVSNNIQFLPTNENNVTWSIRTVADLTTNPADEQYDYSVEDNYIGNQTELLNNKFYDTLNTYTTIVTNKSMGDVQLYPEEAEIEGVVSSSSTTMRLSTTLVPDSGEETMVYNNLAEIVQVSNSQGRRLKYSVTGNQPMANQESGPDVPEDPDNGVYTKIDIVTPTEIDSDSSQELLILPPTGANRNYTLWIIVGVVALLIVAGGVFFIIRYFKKK